MTWTPPDDRFLNTFGVCRPCHDHHAVWAKYHDMWGVPWEQDSLGMYAEIGKVDKRPIVVSVYWANIAERRVAFVEPTSLLVDYGMVEQWCSAVFPNAVTFADEGNFHNIVGVIEDALNVKSIMARNHVFDLYAKHAPANPNYMLRAKDASSTAGVGETFKYIKYRDLPKDPNNGGWRKKLLLMDWHEVCLDGYLGWELETVDGSAKAPPFIKLTHTRQAAGPCWSNEVESSTLANKWDDIAKEPFYTRDWTDDGIPFVRHGGTYWSGWWFKTVAERDRFVAWQKTQS